MENRNYKKFNQNQIGITKGNSKSNNKFKIDKNFQ